MSPRLVNLNPSTHHRVQDLLPWYVMESLDGEERTLVEEHLATCLICQRDVEWHRELRAACDEAVPPFDVERALASVKSMTGEAESRRRPSHKPRAAWLSWTGGAIAVQAAIIACFFAITKSPEPASPAIYRAQGQAAAADSSSRLLVVFAPQVTEEELRGILRDGGARIVDGPTSTDAYVLEVPRQRASATLLALRAEPRVTLVESLDQEALH